MKREITRLPKVALCRVCKGTGQMKKPPQDGHGPERTVSYITCPQCEGSGRVTVSCEMTLDIRPYKPKKTKAMT